MCADRDISQVILETDSSCAADLLLKELPTTLLDFYLVASCKDLIHNLGEVKFSRISRKANSIADCLANNTVPNSMGIIIQFNPPEFIYASLYSDLALYMGNSY